MSTKQAHNAASDSSDDGIPERPVFSLATRVKVTSPKVYTDSYSFELVIQYIGDEGKIEVSLVDLQCSVVARELLLISVAQLKGTLDLKPEMIVKVNSLTFYGEEVGQFSGNITEPPFRFEHDVVLNETKGLVRFFIDQTESLVFGIDIRKKDGTHQRTMKRVAYIHQESYIF